MNETEQVLADWAFDLAQQFEHTFDPPSWDDIYWEAYGHELLKGLPDNAIRRRMASSTANVYWGILKGWN